MRNYICIGIFVVSCALTFVPAKAGQLFPPADASKSNSTADKYECPAGKTMLAWDGDTVKCSAPLANINCGTGKYLQGFDTNGTKVCLDLPTATGTGTTNLPPATCTSATYPAWNGSSWVCKAFPVTGTTTIPDEGDTVCPQSWQVKQWNGTRWICINPPKGTYVGFARVDFSWGGSGTGWRCSTATEPAYCTSGGPACRPGFSPKIIDQTPCSGGVGGVCYKAAACMKG